MDNANKLPRILNLQPHAGSPGIIIGIDVGTTFSGVSYALLRPDEIPEVLTVTSFTDQTLTDLKIPSIVYYDKDLRLKAAGATAAKEAIGINAEIEGWTKVEFFKMHLKPADMKIESNGLNLGSLHPSLTATKVMADFLRYLYEETVKYIEERHSDGDEMLRKVSGRETFVLSHPNGWTGLPQQHMRDAAILGGLIGGSESERARLKFVSEGEASALACLAGQGGIYTSNLQAGHRFIVADAGGGTLDMTSYEITETSPLQLKELTSSDCRFAGSLFINMRARDLLKKRLRDSQYDNPDTLDEIVNDSFERIVKRQFQDESKVDWMKIGNRSENYPEIGVRSGNLRITGSELADCFRFSVDEALKSIEQQIKACGDSPMPVWLVGGFGSSPWLLKKLKEGLKKRGVAVIRPDFNLSKAVANGNVYYALENPVTARFTRVSYGIRCLSLYFPSDPEHVKRKHLVYKDVDGAVRVPGMFEYIVRKNTEVQEREEYDSAFSKNIKLKSKASNFSTTLYCYEGQPPEPVWYDVNKTSFRHACTIKADLSSMCRSSLHIKNEETGEKYWRLDFKVELMFGLTELQARIKWDDQGVKKYGPAAIFYEE